jgi:hypothetical protein
MDATAGKQQISDLEMQVQQLTDSSAKRMEAQAQMHDEVARRIESQIQQVQSGSDLVQLQTPG